MTTNSKPSFAAGDRVALLKDHGGLKRGMLGTVTRHGTIRSTISISPDPSGNAVYVVFDNVIGIITMPIDDLEKMN